MKLLKKESSIIIIGCGSIGSGLASVASNHNYKVTVVDLNEDAFKNLPPDFFGLTLIGDATEVATLIAAGIQSADILVTATNDEDINIMISQIAACHYKLRRSITKINNIYKKAICDRLNIEVICPTLLFMNETERVLFDIGEDKAV